MPNSVGTTTGLPLYLSPVEAGFPSPAEDFIEENLDLHQLLVKNPPATFLVRAHGNSMTGYGINSGDILVVDRSIEPTNAKIIIAAINGELTVKCLQKQSGQSKLVAGNPAYPPIVITAETDLTIWGVVTGIVRQL